MIFAISKQSAGEGKRETLVEQTFKYAKCMAFKKNFIPTLICLGFAFYTITDNDLKADSYTCN